MSLWRCAVMCVLVPAGLAVRLAGQEPEDKLAALRTKEALSEEERNELRGWLNQQIASVIDKDTTTAQQAFARLRDGCNGTAGFKQAYVAGCVEQVGAIYKKAPAIAAARLLSLLNVLNDLRSVSVLTEALQDDRAGVRAAAAIALRNLRAKLAADTEAYTRALAALSGAGKKETSAETLQLIYRAMNFTDVQPAPDPKVNAAALLDLLEERSRQFTGETVNAEGAEWPGLKAAGGLSKGMDEGERKRYAQVLARTLHFAVGRYACGDTPLYRFQDRIAGPDALARRNGMELLIKEAEAQLKGILSSASAPQVTEKMQGANPIDMVNEMNRWVGLVNEALGLDLPVLKAPAPEPTRPKPKAGP